MTGMEPVADSFGGTDEARSPVPVISPPSLLLARLARLRSFRQPTVEEMQEKELLEDVWKRKTMT